MRRATLALALALVAAACSSGGEEAGAADETTTTTSSTTIGEATPTTAAANAGEGGLAIETVGFGDGAFVVITNTGGEPTELSGHWLCRRPNYVQLPDVSVGVGERVAIPLGDAQIEPPEGAITVEPISGLGTFDPDSGEVGLYRSSAFDDPDAIVAYVEWGQSGHGRSGTATAAGVWADGGFVATTEATTSISAATLPAVAAGIWSPDG